MACRALWFSQDPTGPPAQAKVMHEVLHRALRSEPVTDDLVALARVPLQRVRIDDLQHARDLARMPDASSFASDSVTPGRRTPSIVASNS